MVEIWQLHVIFMAVFLGLPAGLAYRQRFMECMNARLGQKGTNRFKWFRPALDSAMVQTRSRLMRLRPNTSAAGCQMAISRPLGRSSLDVRSVAMILAVMAALGGFAFQASLAQEEEAAIIQDAFGINLEPIRTAVNKAVQLYDSEGSGAFEIIASAEADWITHPVFVLNATTGAVAAYSEHPHLKGIIHDGIFEADRPYEKIVSDARDSDGAWTMYQSDTDTRLNFVWVSLHDGYLFGSEFLLYDERVSFDITIHGSMWVVVPLGSAYLDEGATCTDSSGTEMAAYITPRTAVNPVVHGTYYVLYSCIGGDGNTNGRVVWVVDPALNGAPSADAGIDLTVPTGSRVVLDGLASSDPDGHPLTYMWSQTGGNATMSMAKSASHHAVFTAPSHPDVLAFQLSVSDGLSSSSDTVTVTVSDPVSADTTVSDPVSADTTVSDPVSADTTVSDPVSADTTVSDPVSADTTVSDPVSADTTVSDPVSADTGGTNAEPREITWLALESTSPGTIYIFWNVPAEVPRDYRVSWALLGEPYLTWTDLYGNAFPTDSSYTISDLEEGQTYKVKVRARYDQGGSGAWSDEITIAAARSSPEGG